MLEGAIQFHLLPEQRQEVTEILVFKKGWWSGWSISPSTNGRLLAYVYGKKAPRIDSIDADLFIRTNGTCQHPHAELMAEYAKDAAETDRPWERWEFSAIGTNFWLTCLVNPEWNESRKYRRKPQRRTVTMPDGTVLPEPVREALKDGEKYFLVDLLDKRLTTYYNWRGNAVDKELLKRGFIHRTEEDAKAWAEYLLKLTKGV